MDLSIIIPTYNSSGFVGRTLDSVHKAAAGYIYEIIVVDDCSHDVQLLRQIISNSANTVLVEKKVKSNAADSRNIGVERSRGRYVFLLDSDDYYKEEYIVRRTEFMDRTGCEFCFGGYTSFANEVYEDVVAPPIALDALSYLFLENKDIRSSTISFIGDRRNKFQFNTALEKHQDWAFFIDVAAMSCFWRYDAYPGVVLDCSRGGRMSSSMNIRASSMFQKLYLSERSHISGFASRHVLAALLQNNFVAYRHFSARLDTSIAATSLVLIKRIGDSLDRLGCLFLLPPLLAAVRRARLRFKEKISHDR